MQYAIYETKLGLIKIGYENDTIKSIGRIEETDVASSVKTPLTDVVQEQLNEYFEGKRQTFEFSYEASGTEFQKKVWQALSEIPYGETRSYKEIAIQIGNAKACRAVGMANNKNPIGIVIPCHRVIGANGKLIGYAGGLEMKQSLIKLEYDVLNQTK